MYVAGGGTIIPHPIVNFLSETLPDSTYQIGTATKTWTFKNGTTPITGLKAVQVADKTSVGLGITSTEVALGDVAVNAEFTVSLPIAPEHNAPAVKSSYWKLVDGAGKEVAITNSKTGQFWLKVRTNQAPVFTLQQMATAFAKVDAAIALPIAVQDADGDALTVTASAGVVENGQWTGSFGAAGVHAVTLTLTDGIESATKTLSVAVRDDAGMARSFVDAQPDSTVTACSTPPLREDGSIDWSASGGEGRPEDYANIQYLYLLGVAQGSLVDGKLYFHPCRYATQAEALKMVMTAARIASGLVFDEPLRVLPNLLVEDAVNGIFEDTRWATPYVLKAEAMGALAAAEDFRPQAPATRAWMARMVNAVQQLNVPLDALVDAETLYQFPDQADFGSTQDYEDALATAFFGYMGKLTEPFHPGDAMIRADVARVASRILRAPHAKDIVLGGVEEVTLQGQTMPGVVQGNDFTVTGIEDLQANRILQGGDLVKEEWIDPPARYVRATVVRTGEGTVPGGKDVMVQDLASAPVAVPTATPPAPGTEVRNLLVVLEEIDTGVRSVLRKNYAVLVPDRDGDGVQDEQDAWPDNPLFSDDINGNGIPDVVDAVFGLADRVGTELVRIGDQDVPISEALNAGQFSELAQAVGASSGGTGGGVSIGGNADGSVGTALPLGFAAGWNMSGNGSDIPIDVATTFGDRTLVKTVWKWQRAPDSRWAFYTPSMEGQALADYQTRMGYAPLTTIEAGEGFWVNARKPFTATVVGGYAVTAAQLGSVLIQGWNLVSIGEEPQTPRAFHEAVGSRVVSLWMWDNALNRWYFYAPDYEADGTLLNFIRVRNFLDFSENNRLLGWGSGFWVNKR